MAHRRIYRRFSVATLERIAKELRTKHGKCDGKRLLVEHLVDKLGFDVIPRVGLRDEMGIEAYLPKRANTIIVDKAQMDFGSPRYMFTLTEEVAHSIIHLQGQIAGHSATVDLLHEWIMGLTNDEHQDMEMDAKYLAGAILMPRDEFIKLFKGHCSAQHKALGTAGDRHTLIRFAVRRLYMTYCVSFEAAAYRAKHLGLIKAHDLALLARYRPAAFSSLAK